MARKPKKLKLEDILAEEKNLANRLDSTVLDKMTQYVIENYRKDKDSRSEWEKRSAEAMKLALQVVETKSYPWQNAANVKYPLITVGALQFSARVNLFPNNEIVRAQVVGYDRDGARTERAIRVGKHMTHQCKNVIDAWEDNNDRLHLALPIMGSMFKKTYWNPMEKKIYSDIIYPRDLVFDYYAKSVECAHRKTLRLKFSKNKILERMRWGLYTKFDLDEEAVHDDDPLDDKISGMSAPTGENAPYTVLEMHTYWDLDGDGYEEPVIITVLEQNEKLLRVVANFDEDGVKRNDGEVFRIEPTEYFTQYTFIPDPNGGNLGLGFGHLLGPINQSVNTLINQLLDSGTLNNLGGGLIGKNLRLKAGLNRRQPGEYYPVNNTGEDIAKSIYPFPRNEPSAVLFNLLGLLQQAGERVSSVTDVMMGDNPPTNQPATTTLAMVEQGLSVFKQVHARLYRAYSKEFKKQYTLNRKYLTDPEYFTVLSIPPEQMVKLRTPTRIAFAKTGQLTVVANDYADDMGVVPTADPTVITAQEKYKKVELLLQTMGLGWNPEVIKRRLLEAMDIPNPEELMQPMQPQPNPEVELEKAKLELEAQRMQMEQQAKQAELQLKQMELQLDAEKLKGDLALIQAQIAKLTGESTEESRREAEKLLQEYKIHTEELRFKYDELDLKRREAVENAKLQKAEIEVKKKQAEKPIATGGQAKKE